ncbi:MAG: hypothetical protein ACPGWR_01460 [Ardenticatenaceae bacterium]
MIGIQHQQPQKITATTSATQYVLFLPLNYNNGRRIENRQLQQAQQTLLTYAGGLTQLAPATGMWIGRTGTVYRDQMMPIMVVTTAPEAESWFAQWATQMAILFGQEQIFLLAQPVRLIESVPLAVPPAYSRSP